MKAKKLINQDRVLDIFLYIFLSIMIIAFAYPIYFVLIASVSNATVVNSGKLLLWPQGFHLAGYKYILNEPRILTGYGNTIIYVVFGTLLGLACSLSAGYSLSRKDLPGRGIIMAMFVITMYFSGGLIPFYLVIKSIGLLNTRLLLIVSGSVSAYNIIVIRTFFSSTISEELHEAAVIEGCGNMRFFFQFALPLSKAVISVIGLFLAVNYWNSYFEAMVFVADTKKHPLQLYLRQILLVSIDMKGGNPEDITEMNRIVQVIKYAVIVVSTLPIMCVYPFLQKYFVQGVMIGSLKG